MNARVDGLEKRVETPTDMTEIFGHRDDFLIYRRVEYGVRPKKFGPAEDITVRPIEVRGFDSRRETGGSRNLRFYCYITFSI